MTELGKAPEDINAKMRHDLWVHMGHPTAPEFIEEGIYEREFKRRTMFQNKSAMMQYQLVRKVLLCMACMETKPPGLLFATRLFIGVEDDLMTVFKAMGHAVCHRCGFEEWYPLMKDPRPNKIDAMAQMAQQQAAMQRAQGPPPPPPGYMGQGMGVGMLAQQPAMGSPLAGMAMTATEMAALQRLYVEQAKRKASPPIVTPKKP